MLEVKRGEMDPFGKERVWGEVRYFEYAREGETGNMICSFAIFSTFSPELSGLSFLNIFTRTIWTVINVIESFLIIESVTFL